MEQLNLESLGQIALITIVVFAALVAWGFWPRRSRVVDSEFDTYDGQSDWARWQARDTPPQATAVARQSVAARPLPDDPAARTRTAVEALPKTVTWPTGAMSTALPLAFDGTSWAPFALDGGEHLLICGTSGSGKGNLLQYLLLLALRLGPQRAQVWVVDPKNGLDYAFATGLTHARLYADIPDADGTVTAGLDAAKALMEARNKQMFGKARKIQEWNQRYPDEALPYILLIVDEVAELTGPQHATLCTLARMARSAGIVVVPVTQYPTADVLPSQIQANCLNRVCLKVDSTKRSDVSLGLERGDERAYEPSAIVESGVAVVRRAGNRWSLGRIPEVTSELHERLVNELTAAYPRQTGEIPQGQAAPREPQRSELAQRIASYLDSRTSAEAEALTLRGVCTALSIDPAGGDWTRFKETLETLATEGHANALLLLQRRAKSSAIAA